LKKLPLPPSKKPKFALEKGRLGYKTILAIHGLGPGKKIFVKVGGSDPREPPNGSKEVAKKFRQGKLGGCRRKT